MDDRPARLADLVQEELAEGGDLLDEQVELILARAVAGRAPCVTFGADVDSDGLHPSGGAASDKS